MNRTAVVAGASGLVGGRLLNALLDADDYARVIAPVRHALQDEHPKLEQRIVDFERLAFTETLEGADVFCALGTTMKKAGSRQAFRKVDFEYSLRLAETTRSAGAQQFLLVSSVGASASASNFYLRVKGELEEAVEKLGFPSLHVFRPSLLLGERPERRTAERIGIAFGRAIGFAMAGPLRRYHAIHAEEVAAAMIAAARSGAQGAWIHEYDEIKDLANARGSRTT